jgi:hypothetical protein
MILEETDGYKMGQPGKRDLKRTYSMFIDDLKVYQENHQKLEVANETIVKASMDTGACYGVKKCAEIVFKNGKMVIGSSGREDESTGPRTERSVHISRL